MRKSLLLLVAPVILAYACCNDKGDDGGEQKDTKIDVLVCMCESDEATAVLGNGYNIVAMLPDGTQKAVLLAATEDQPRPKQASIGSDGITLLFSDDNGQGVKTMDLTTGIKTSVIDEYDGENDYEVPVFSPDMSTVYVMDNMYEDSYCTVNVATGTKAIINEVDRLTYGSFSADGKTMVVSHQWGLDIATMNPDGTDLTLIKEAEYEENFEVSYNHPMSIPKLNKIIYVKYYEDNANASSYSICICGMDGSNEIELVSADEQLGSPTASADGKKVAYYRNSDGKIVVADFDGTALSNEIALDGIGTRTWRPQFNRIEKEVFEAMTPIE